MRDDPEMKAFMGALNIVTPRNERYLRGWKEVFTLQTKASDKEALKYYNLTWLYPYVNKTQK